MAANNRDPIIVDALRRFPNLGNRTIARYIIDTVGDKYNNDLEKVRSAVRHLRGANGSESRLIAERQAEKFTRGEVKMPVTWRKTRADYILGVGTWLVIGDLHVPYHEPLAIEAAVAYGKKQRVDGVFINGDLMDNSALGFWRQRRKSWNEELEKSLDLLDWLRRKFPAPKHNIVYKPGNHEYRLVDYFVGHAPDLAESPLAAMETVMGFEERGIEFLDYNQKVKAGDVSILHGHEVKLGGNVVSPARGLFLKTNATAICGHCHSTSKHAPKDLDGRSITNWTVGCLCDLHPDWNPFSNRWNWGFAIVKIESGGRVEVENREIDEGSGRVV